MIRRRIGIILLCVFMWQNFAMAVESTNAVQVFKEDKLSSTSTILPSIVDINKNFHNSLEKEIQENPFIGKEIDTLFLEKGSKFYVKSLQPMSSDTPEGSRIEFETETKLFSEDRLSKVIFTGEVVENNPPRRAGRSSSIKLEISKIKVDNVTYRTKAIVSKMGNKAVRNGMIVGMPIYLNNLADTADAGTVTMDKLYMDPCEYHCAPGSTVVRPLYYLGAALLQLADLLLVAPIASLFQRGDVIDIPKDSSFEIKLASDMALLKI